MTMLNFLPGRRDCRGIMHVKNHFGEGIVEIRCKLQWGHVGPHIGYAWGQLSRWHNAVEHRDHLSQRFDNPNAKSATGVNGRQYFILGPANSLRKK